MEDLIRREPALCYRLLRYLNSPLLGVASPVLSIRHGLNLLGERELVRWIRMATAMIIGQEKSSDLVLSSLVRARFCELIAPKLKPTKSDLYLMGLLSLMDAILEAPMAVVLDELPLDRRNQGATALRQDGQQDLPLAYLRSHGGERDRRLGAGYEAGERAESVSVLRFRGVQRSHALGPPGQQRNRPPQPQ